MTVRAFLVGCALLTLCACGGGGGGSGPNNPPANPPAGGSGSGTGGGTSGGGGTVIGGGLISGGVGVAVDTSIPGVQLDVAVGGTGMVAGDIQAFGSVIVNDVTTQTSSADFLVEGAPAIQADLEQGQQVLIIVGSTANSAIQVRYRSNVKGEVSSVTIEDSALGRATLVVLGQTVTTNATTTFANIDLVDIGVGTLLEVSGTIDSSGAVAASYVALRSALTQYKVTGQVESVTATEIVLGGLTVDFSSATLRDFDSGTIEVGDVVEVRGAPVDFTAPAAIIASEVERLSILTLGGDAIVQIEGVIDEFSSTSEFEVQTTPISTNSSTNYINGAASNLELGVKVQVEGTADGNGSILAQSVTIQSTNTIRAEGDIEAIDITAGTITVLGLTFSVRDLTEFDDNSSASIDPLTIVDLGINDEVEVRGYLDGTTVVATRLDREDPEDRARLRGRVTAEDAAAGLLDILNIEISGQQGITEYQDVDDGTITQAEFHSALGLGDTVSARWNTYTSTSVLADELSLEADED